MAIGIGEYVISPLAEKTGDGWGIVREDKDYKEIQGEKREEDHKEALEYLTGSGDPYTSTKEILANSKSIREKLIANKASKATITTFDNAINEAKNTGTFGKNNPEAQRILKDINAGKYGSDIKDIFTNKQGDARGMNRAANYEKVKGSEKIKIEENKENIKSKKRANAGIGLSLAQPFISSIFSRETFIQAMEAKQSKEEEDATNKIGVFSKDV